MISCKGSKDSNNRQHPNSTILVTVAAATWLGQAHRRSPRLPSMRIAHPADDDDEGAHVEARAVLHGAVLVEDRQRPGPGVPRRDPKHLSGTGRKAEEPAFARVANLA